MATTTKHTGFMPIMSTTREEMSKEQIDKIIDAALKIAPMSYPSCKDCQNFRMCKRCTEEINKIMDYFNQHCERDSPCDVCDVCDSFDNDTFECDKCTHERRCEDCDYEVNRFLDS